MSKTFYIAGSSDDTFGAVKGPGDDFDNCASGKPIVWRIASGAGSLLVWGQYAPAAIRSGSWVVGVAHDETPDSDELPLPAWPIRIEPAEWDYSPLLVIEAPEDAVMTRHYPEREE